MERRGEPPGHTPTLFLARHQTLCSQARGFTIASSLDASAWLPLVSSTAIYTLHRAIRYSKCHVPVLLKAPPFHDGLVARLLDTSCVCSYNVCSGTIADNFVQSVKCGGPHDHTADQLYCSRDRLASRYRCAKTSSFRCRREARLVPAHGPWTDGKTCC